MPDELLIDDVRPWLDGTEAAAPCAITIRGGQITAIGDAPSSWTGPRVEGRGLLALPTFVDAHAHLDKTLWGLPWRPHSAPPGLMGLITNEQQHRTELPTVEERATALLQTYLETGTTRVRTHVDVDPAQGLAAVEGVLAAAASFGNKLAVEVVAFPQSGMLIAPGTVELLDAAIGAGASLVGGIDPASLERDPVAHLDAIFGIAQQRGCGVDLHLHDGGSLGRWQVELVIERTRAADMAGLVTVSHAFCLADGDPEVDPLLEQIAEAGISLTTVAPGNAPPLPFARLAELGIPVGLGQDGVRDLWSPWGDGDMLGRARQLAHRLGHRRDEAITTALALATTGGAQLLGVTDHGLQVGSRGDVVLVDAATPAQAVVDAPRRELVVSAGQIITQLTHA